MTDSGDSNKISDKQRKPDPVHAALSRGYMPEYKDQVRSVSDPPAKEAPFAQAHVVAENGIKVKAQVLPKQRAAVKADMALESELDSQKITIQSQRETIDKLRSELRVCRLREEVILRSNRDLEQIVAVLQDEIKNLQSWHRHELDAMQQTSKGREVYDEDEDPESVISTAAIAAGPLVVDAATGSVKRSNTGRTPPWPC